MRGESPEQACLAAATPASTRTLLSIGSYPTTPLETVCPFCPLRCRELPVSDDKDGGSGAASGSALEAEADLAGAVKLAVAYCPLAAERLRRAGMATESCSSQENLAGVRQFLSRVDGKSRRVEVGGTFVDVQTARAAIRLAAAFDGCIDAQVGPSESCLGDVLEREGWIGATLGEVAERADSLLLLGPVEAELPRLWQMFGQSESLPASLSLPASRRVLRSADLQTGWNIALDGQNEALADWVDQAKYLAVLCAGNSLDLCSAAALVRWVSQINQTGDRRAVLVPVSEATTFRTTAAWLTGFGGPIRFRAGLPELVERSTLVTDVRDQAEGDRFAVPDVRIWLQPFPDSPTPPNDAATLIVVGAAGAELSQRSDFYFRTTMPGIEVAGTTFRGDGTVALPLMRWRSANWPSASEVLGELAAIW